MMTGATMPCQTVRLLIPEAQEVCWYRLHAVYGALLGTLFIITRTVCVTVRRIITDTHLHIVSCHIVYYTNQVPNIISRRGR